MVSTHKPVTDEETAKVAPYKPAMWVVMGKSNSGKDVSTGFLQGLVAGSQVIKFVAPFKGLIETAYGLPAGAMEDDHYRYAQLPNGPEGFTYLDLKIAAYHASPGSYGYVWDQMNRNRIEAALADGQDVIFNDLRNQHEADLVAEYKRQGYQLNYIAIERKAVKGTTSDENLIPLSCQVGLIADHLCYLNNDGTLQDLKEALTRWHSDIFPTP